MAGPFQSRGQRLFISARHSGESRNPGHPQHNAPHAVRHFTVPASMADLFPKERFMVIGRDADSITLTPTDYVPFEEALEAFRANGLSEEQVLEISAT